MELQNYQEAIYNNKLRRNFNTTDVGKEIILMTEELGEFCDAYLEADKEEIIDAFGDIMVYGLGLTAMFGWNANQIVNANPEYKQKPTQLLEHLPYLVKSIGSIAKTFKKSNKELLPNLNHQEKFQTNIGNLLGYCIKAIEFTGETYKSVLESIIENNTTRTHQGKI